MPRLIRLGVFLIGCLSVTAFAVEEIYPFANDQQRAQYKSLIADLRCPKCQNQNLADSDAPIAKDLRNKVFEMINQGKTSPQITNYLVDRYGEFVRYNPSFNWHTVWLWVLPIGVLLVGLIIIIRTVRGGSSVASTSAGASRAPKLSAADILAQESQQK